MQLREPLHRPAVAPKAAESRLIGIDTPETSSACGAQPLSGEAESFARSKLAGEKVALELGAEEVDQYDRTLAYLYTSPEQMFNKSLLREGLAQVYTVPPNDRYEGDFLAAQEKARAAGAGIWGLSLARQDNLASRGNGIGGGCNEEPEPAPQPAPEPSPEPDPTPSPEPSPTPTPSLPENCSEASGPIQVPPGDPTGLDGDGDGMGCESA